jgi:hypothetical protein
MYSKLNFRETHFPMPTLTPISGYPGYSDIQQLQREVSANLHSVPSTLGGGSHGHMGLGLATTPYLRGCDTPFHRPGPPGPYLPPDDPDALVQQRAEREHKEALEVFQMVNHLERTCLNMIKSALAPSILLPKTDRFTGAIKGTIPEIIQYLFDSYGNLTAFSVESKRQALLAISYNHAEPLDFVFNAVSDYADMAEAYGTSISDDQLMSLALIIIMKANIFADGIETWNVEPIKTWLAFQTFFTKAQSTYKKARPTETAAARGYTPAQANAAFFDPTSTLKEAEAYIAELEAAAPATLGPPAPAQANIIAPAPAPFTPPNDLLIEKLLAQMAELQSQVSTKKNRKHKDKDKSSPKERLYCWTHGSCAHKGTDCKNPKDGHKKEATFANIE